MRENGLPPKKVSLKCALPSPRDRRSAHCPQKSPSTVVEMLARVTARSFRSPARRNSETAHKHVTLEMPENGLDVIIITRDCDPPGLFGRLRLGFSFLTMEVATTRARCHSCVAEYAKLIHKLIRVLFHRLGALIPWWQLA